MTVNNVRKGSSGAPTPFWNKVCANAYLDFKCNTITTTTSITTTTTTTTTRPSTQYPEFGPRLSSETENSSLRTANVQGCPISSGRRELSEQEAV